MSTTYNDLPDWTDISVYPDTKAFSHSQWAWEFLRRTDDYRKDWNTFCGEIKSKLKVVSVLAPNIAQFENQGGVAKAVGAALKNLSPMFSLSDFLELSDAEKEKRELFLQSNLQLYLALSDIKKASFYSACKWQLADMLDPTHSFDTNIEFNISVVKGETGQEREQRTTFERFALSTLPEMQGIKLDNLVMDDTWLNESFFLHLTIDMRTPIGIVKQHVLAELERRYREIESADYVRIDIRDRSDKYLLYLRTLDAIKDGAENDDIGEVLFSGQYAGDLAARRKQVSNTIKAAKKAQENYWQIAHLNKP